MKIWLLTSQFPPAPGGIARYVANAAAMFVQGGHQVMVFAADDHDSSETLASGAELLRFAIKHTEPSTLFSGPASAHPAFPANILAHSAARSYSFAAHLERAVEQYGLPDILECQEYAALPYFLTQRRLLGRHSLSTVPLLVHLHSPDFVLSPANQEPSFRMPGYWTGRMEQFCITASDGLLCPSSYLAQQVAQAVPQAPRAQIIPYPYQSLPSQIGTPMHGDLVFLGRLEARKGVLKLIEACERLWMTGLEFHLTLIGDDTLFSPRSMPMGSY